MNIIFQIDGGIGKSVAATAVCTAIMEQYPNDRLIVITGYPEVFLCCPGMRVFGFNDMRYFYEQYIEGQEVKVFAHNPYLASDFIMQRGHLVKVWSEMFGIKYNGEQPKLYINNREQNLYGNQVAAMLRNSQKPILVMQTNGGGKDQPNKYSWARDLPTATAQKIVYAFANDYNIVHIRREDQIPLQGTIPMHGDFRALAVLISMSAKRLFIDSFAQHTAAALGLPSVVCWIGNTPSQFGYELHNNIIANAPTLKPELRHSVLSRYNISGNATEFPYNNEDEIFDVDVIINALKDESGKESGEREKGESSTPSLKATTTEEKESGKESGERGSGEGESEKQSGSGEGESGKQSGSVKAEEELKAEQKTKSQRKEKLEMAEN